MKKIAFIFTTLFVLPLVTFAQTVSSGPTQTVSSGPTLAPLRIFVAGVSDLVSLAVPLIIGLAVVAFFWGLVRYIFAGAKGSAAGKNIMVWGLIALFVMVSIWGIITMAQGALGIQGSAVPTFPRVPGVGFSR